MHGSSGSGGTGTGGTGANITSSTSDQTAPAISAHGLVPRALHTVRHFFCHPSEAVKWEQAGLTAVTLSCRFLQFGDEKVDDLLDRV